MNRLYKYILTLALMFPIISGNAQEALQQRIDSALAYDSYADICADSGKFREAKEYYLKAFHCYPPELDDIGHGIRPVFCQKIASMMTALADYSEAIAYLDRADSLLATSGQTDARFIAALKNTKASLHSYLGNIQEALLLWEEALDLIEYGTGDHTVITENIADMMIDNGAYTEAISLLLVNALTPESSARDSISVYRKLSKALALQGRDMPAGYYFKRADHYLRQAGQMTARYFAFDSYMLAEQEETSAFVHEMSGHFAEAYNEYSKAYETFSAYHGKDHPGSISCKMGMAKSALMAGEKASAWKAYQEYLTLKQEYLASEMSRMNYRDMTSYWLRSNEGYIDAPLFCLKTGTYSGPEAGSVLNAVMFAKSVTLDMSMNFKEAAGMSSDSGTKETYQKLKDCRAVINKMLPQQKNPIRRDSLKAEARRLEKELRSRLFKEGLLCDSIAYLDWRLTAELMDDNAVAIEFADFMDGDARKYCAFVYKKADKNPSFVPLCTENELTEICGNEIFYTQEAVEGSFSIDRLGKIYDLIWKPLEKNFAPDKDIFFAPSGLLNNIPLEYTGTDTDGMAVDKCRTMRRINVTKNIPQAKSTGKFDRIVLYGDMNYYEGSTSRTSANAFCPLPGSRRELASIKASLGSRMQIIERVKKNATEADFKSLKLPHDGNAILHMSTHGFYLPAGIAQSQYYYTRYSIEDLERFPLLRSAIVMSQANLVWTGIRQPDEMEEDGILTAQEIAGTNLRGVSLVVLSACQSGLGDIGSEGVIGMQRAFRTAGAGSTLVSLWPTDDAGAAFLMGHFYAAIANGLDAHSALNQAVKEVRKVPAFQSPFYWAPFVIVD